MIPTSQEFLSDEINRVAFPHIDEYIEDKKAEAETILDCMKKFAKLHVENFAKLLEESNITAKEYLELHVK